MQHFTARPHRHELLDAGRSRGGYVLEFESNGVDAVSKIAQRVEILVGRADFAVGNLPGGSFAIRRKRVDAIAELARFDSEHAAQLSAAEHTQRGAGGDDLNQGDPPSRARSAPRGRHAASCATRDGSCSI